MKRFLAILLALALITGFALAESLSDVSDYVESLGYRTASIKNKYNLIGCWFVEGTDTDTLQWSDKSRIYTISDSASSDLRALYAEIAGMYPWDTCSYSVGDKVQFAYNAPDSNAAKTYKTLNNYVKYVSEYLEKQQPVTAPAKKKGRQTYIVNKNSKIFHDPDCAFAKKIKKENKEKYTGNRSDLIAQGYNPCKKCNP